MLASEGTEAECVESKGVVAGKGRESRRPNEQVGKSLWLRLGVRKDFSRKRIESSSSNENIFASSSPETVTMSRMKNVIFQRRWGRQQNPRPSTKLSQKHGDKNCSE